MLHQLTLSDVHNNHLIIQLMEVLWKLQGVHPQNLALAPVVIPGLRHTDAIVHAVVEIIHAFTICDIEGFTPIAAKLYSKLLLCSDPAINFTAKRALIRTLRPRYKRRRVNIPNSISINDEAEERSYSRSCHSIGELSHNVVQFKNLSILAELLQFNI